MADVIRTPAPADGLDKWDWPTVRHIESFEPGTGVMKLDYGGRGGWVHLIRWWVRTPQWTANNPVHTPQDHPVGSSRGHAGSERWVGYGWVSAPPQGADMVEIVFSAPDGAIPKFWRTS